MGELGTTAMAIGSTHDLNDMFGTEKKKRAWNRIRKLRSEKDPDNNYPFKYFLTPSLDTTNKTPRLQSLRFAAAELTRHVKWDVTDPSRGDRKVLLRWLTWVELAKGRRDEAKKLMSALNYFSNAPDEDSPPNIKFVWSEDVKTQNGSFSIEVDPPDYDTKPYDPGNAITITVSATDIYHNKTLGNADEED